MKNLSDFTVGYLKAALFTGLDERDIPLDKRLSIDLDCSSDVLGAFDPEAIEHASNDCGLFEREQSTLIEQAREIDPDYNAERAGHDFWLTRNGHGAGFWDRDLGMTGEVLTLAAKRFGSSDAYLGDDGKVWFA